MKNLFTLILALFVFSTLFFVFKSVVKADTQCGAGAYCTGNNAYLKVNDCDLFGGGSYCGNRNSTLQYNYPHTCPTTGGSGTCVAFADGKDGCNPAVTPAVGSTCSCFDGSGPCASQGVQCGFSLPYTSTCNCTGGSPTCGSPQGGALGCCLAGAYCGDNACNNSETCSSCPSDCGTCSGATAVPTCGNGTCGSGESCNTCPQDCGTCVSCGDGTCNGGETCNTCAQDCGQCPPVCGNHVVESGETCANCPADLGVCPSGGNVCPDGLCGSAENCNICPNDCGACQPPPPPTCTCSAPYCGQLDSCGTAQCSNIDDWAPPAPTQTSPLNNALVTAVDSTNAGVPTKAITLTITTQSSSNYDASLTYIDVYPTGTSCANALAKCNQLVAFGTGPGQVITYTYHIPATSYGLYSSYVWRVWHKNATCTGRVGTATNLITFKVGDTISGKILRDDGLAGFSGGVCTSPLAPAPYVPQGGEQITVTYSGVNYTASLNPDGTFSVVAPISSTGQNSVKFTTSDPTTNCGCPAGCNYSGIDSPSTDVTFYYQPFDVRDPWWQTIGGNLFAGSTSGGAIASSIPVDTCLTGSATCKPFLSLQDGTNANSSGGILTGGGTIDTANTAGFQTDNIDEDNRDYQAIGTTNDTLIENYDYFYRLYSMGLTPVNDINTPANKPNGNPNNQRAFYRNGDLLISNSWTLASNESKVIFVNGNLTVNNTITVPVGGFLAFIVKGNITFGNTVCQNTVDSTTGVVQGVFIANGTMTVANKASGDCKFVGEGIFAAWNGFSLRRDFRDGGAGDFISAQHPVELFKYRPDFVTNVPARMTRPLYQWQEVAP